MKKFIILIVSLSTNTYQAMELPDVEFDDEGKLGFVERKTSALECRKMLKLTEPVLHNNASRALIAENVPQQASPTSKKNDPSSPGLLLPQGVSAFPMLLKKQPSAYITFTCSLCLMQFDDEAKFNTHVAAHNPIERYQRYRKPTPPPANRLPDPRIKESLEASEKPNTDLFVLPKLTAVSYTNDEQKITIILNDKPSGILENTTQSPDDNANGNNAQITQKLSAKPAVADEQPKPEKTARYHCPVRGCFKSYTLPCGLKNHLRSHSPDKTISHPYVCQSCAQQGIEKRFSNTSNFDYHNLHTHGIPAPIRRVLKNHNTPIYKALIVRTLKSKYHSKSK